MCVCACVWSWSINRKIRSEFNKCYGGIQGYQNGEQTEKTYFCGIIDILQRYNNKKKGEHFLKSFKYDSVKIKKKKKKKLPKKKKKKDFYFFFVMLFLLLCVCVCVCALLLGGDVFSFFVWLFFFFSNTTELVYFLRTKK